jgi:hypothetical protein
MFHKLLVIIVGILIIACGQNPKTIQKDPNSRQVAIDFADLSVSLPKVFKKFSHDELIYAIKNLDPVDFPEDDRLERIERVEEMRSTDVPHYIYVDTTDINNSIIFQDGEYLKLDKEVRQYILSNADRTLKPKLAKKGVDIKRIENQFFTGKKIEILKLKYELNGTAVDSFTTIYLVTTRSNTLTIFVTRPDSEDFEERITRIRVGLK